MNMYEYNIKDGSGFIFILSENEEDAMDIAFEYCEEVWPDIERNDFELIASLSDIKTGPHEVFEFILIKS